MKKYMIATQDDMYDEKFDMEAAPTFETPEEARFYIVKTYSKPGDRKRYKIWEID